MPNWINPLDRVPQIPQDWANHICYGGALGVVAALAGGYAVGFFVTLGVAAAKKVVDYFKEHETWEMCVGKTLVTAVWPLTLWAVHLIGK